MTPSLVGSIGQDTASLLRLGLSRNLNPGATSEVTKPLADLQDGGSATYVNNFKLRLQLELGFCYYGVRVGGGQWGMMMQPHDAFGSEFSSDGDFGESLGNTVNAIPAPMWLCKCTDTYGGYGQFSQASCCST